MNQIWHRFDGLICTPKISNHLWSHLRAIMALDHSRLGLENKFLETNQAEFFAFDKFALQNLGACKPTYYTFHKSHLWWNSTMRRCFYHTDLRQQYFTILKYKLHSFNIQDDLSMRGLLGKPLKKTFQNHLYGQPVASCGVFEWTLIELGFNIIRRLFFI